MWRGPCDETTVALLSEAWARFSDEELGRRRLALVSAAEDVGCDLLLVYGADRAGSAIPWLTGWPVTREAALVVDVADGPDVLAIQFHNHVPLARELAQGCTVIWAGPSTPDTILELLERNGVGGRRVGVVGPVGFRLYRRIADRARNVVDLGAAYTLLRALKSDEELDWLAVGASLSDRACAALRDALEVGRTDHELLDAVERAYVPLGGTTHIHYLGMTSMADPRRGAPAQFPTGRALQEGDVVVTELSAAFGGYAGQVLRTMTPEAELNSLYGELHAVAEAAFDAVCDAIRPGSTPSDVVAAAGVIEEAGFTTIDDLVHGFGGGYLPPVIGSASRPAGPLPDMVFEERMTVVVQPNVTTPDGRAGVQTGELVVVASDGVRSLHGAPRGPWTAADGGRS